MRSDVENTPGLVEHVVLVRLSSDYRSILMSLAVMKLKAIPGFLTRMLLCG